SSTFCGSEMRQQPQPFAVECRDFLEQRRATFFSSTDLVPVRLTDDLFYRGAARPNPFCRNVDGDLHRAIWSDFGDFAGFVQHRKGRRELVPGVTQLTMKRVVGVVRRYRIRTFCFAHTTLPTQHQVFTYGEICTSRRKATPKCSGAFLECIETRQLFRDPALGFGARSSGRRQRLLPFGVRPQRRLFLTTLCFSLLTSGVSR